MVVVVVVRAIAMILNGKSTPNPTSLKVLPGYLKKKNKAQPASL